jgi:hypothetical protein
MASSRASRSELPPTSLTERTDDHSGSDIDAGRNGQSEVWTRSTVTWTADVSAQAAAWKSRASVMDSGRPLPAQDLRIASARMALVMRARID